MFKRIRRSAWTAYQFHRMGANYLQTAREFMLLMSNDAYFYEWYGFLTEIGD